MADSTEKQTMAERAENLSDEVLERVEARQRAALEALRKFVDRLDDAMPNLGDNPSVRKKVVDAIVDYYEQFATTTNEFVTAMVHNAIGTLNKRAAKKAQKRVAKPAAKRAVPAKKAAKRAAQPAAKRAAQPAAKRAVAAQPAAKRAVAAQPAAKRAAKKAQKRAAQPAAKRAAKKAPKRAAKKAD
jgi:hypothetical protein